MRLTSGAIEQDGRATDQASGIVDRGTFQVAEIIVNEVIAKTQDFHYHYYRSSMDLGRQFGLLGSLELRDTISKLEKH